MSTYYVGPVGPKTAKLAIVAEKPSYDEIASGEPLTGPTGQVLMSMLKRIGLRREDVYLTNAVKHFDNVGNPSNDDIRREQPILFRELAALPNLNCVVALGNSALVSLSNFHYNDIGHRRGSKVLAFNRLKMIPTFHPSYVVQGNWEMGPVVEFDLARAKAESEFPEIRRAERHFNIMPTFREALEWFRHLETGDWLCYDLEMRKAGPHMNWYMTHFGASNDPKEGFCIPLSYQDRRPYWSVDEEAVIFRRIQQLLSIPSKRYVTQNGLNADAWWLFRHGIQCPYMAKGFDTMLAHRYLAPGLPHALEFLVSIYTDEEYYKDESGKHDSNTRVSDEQYQIYNCKDACVQLEVAHAMIEDMVELGLYDYFMTNIQSQWDVILSMRARGFKVDKKRKAELVDRFQKTLLDNEQRLMGELGFIPNTKSPIDMSKVFGKYGVVPRRTPKTKQPVIDEEALLSYAQRWPAAKDVLTNCITINQQRTMLSMYALMTTDPQNFYHASYDVAKAVTGRLASEGPDEGHLLPKKKHAGPQMQNQPRMMRSMFIGDTDDDEITNFDFTQAEPHVVAWDSNDLFYINALLSGKDVHRIAGLVIFKGYAPRGDLPDDTLIASVAKICDKCLAAKEQECTHSERYLAKRCKNGIAYGMQAPRLMTVLRGDNIFISRDLASLIVSRVLTDPLKEWQDRTNFELEKSRWLTNIYGTKREFYGRKDDAMLRDALSWKAQSAVTHLTCHAMRYIHAAIVKERLPASIKTQTHDSCTISHHRSIRGEIIDIVQRATYLPAMVHGRELVIPHELTHGPSWGEQYK